MRITLFFLFFCILFSSASNGYSQEFTIKSRTASIREVCREIEKSSDYIFVFSDNSEKVLEKRVNVEAHSKNVRVILDAILSRTGLTYKILDKQIVVYKSTEAAPSVAVEQPDINIIQQPAKKQITGRIVDAQGEAIIGANVIETGTTNGTITDMDGEFSLSVEDNAKIRVSYIGYLEQSIATVGQSTFNITLLEDTQALDEVVVVGYGVQKKVNLSGAVAAADTKKLEDRPASNIGQALQGAVANLNIDPYSGDPTDLPSFNIRGFTSINGGSPLVVIDGIISDATQLNRLNPADIANISILKDAASSAIYGSRAAFGVILVTTKIGDSEKVAVNYNGNLNWRGLTVTPEYVDDVEVYFRDRNQADTGSPNSGLWPEEMFDAIKAWKKDPEKNPNYYYYPRFDSYFYFDFFNPAKTYIKNNAFSTNHNINVSGKTDKVNYYASGNFTGQDGLLKYGRNHYNQYNVRTKLDIQITPWWKFGTNTSLISTVYKTNTFYLNYHDDTRGNVWNYGTVIEKMLSKIQFGPYYLDKNGLTYDWANEIGQMEQGGDAQKDDLIVNQLFSTRVDIFKDVLYINGNFNYSWQKTATNLQTLPFLGTGGGDTEPYIINNISSAEARNGRVQHNVWDVFGTFHKDFEEKHDLTAILGFNQEFYRYNQQNVSRDHLISPSVPSYNLAYGTTVGTENTLTYSLRGLYGRLGYIFNDKYIAEFNFRRDMTSRFPRQSRSVLSPSGSVGWIVSQENFFEPLRNVIDLFKIRGSYGKLGNQEVDAYAYIPTMKAQRYSYAIGGSIPMYVSTPGLVAGDLTWEKVTTADIGIDLIMLNNRLAFSGDIYRRDTKDMLTTQGRDLPSVLGAAVPQENAADLKTIGWDLTVGWHDRFNVGGKPFSYNIDFTLADSYAKITKVVNSAGMWELYYPGKELGEIWGLNTLGIFATDEEAKNWADQSEVLYQAAKYPSRAGTIKFEDRNGDDKITAGQWTLDDPGDYYKIGNSSIRYRFGLTLGAQWNGFDFSSFFQGVMKHDYYPNMFDRFFWGMFSANWFGEPLYNYTDRWTEENRDINKYFPRLEQGNAHSYYKELGIPQTRYLQNGAYIRLKNLTFGYTLPSFLFRKLPIQRVRFYYSGENLFFISGLHKGYKSDPENLGFQYYPLQKHHSIGVNVTF